MARRSVPYAYQRPMRLRMTGVETLPPRNDAEDSERKQEEGLETHSVEVPSEHRCTRQACAVRAARYG